MLDIFSSIIIIIIIDFSGIQLEHKSWAVLSKPRLKLNRPEWNVAT